MAFNEGNGRVVIEPVVAATTWRTYYHVLVVAQ
jgi:hypothetical protein